MVVLKQGKKHSSNWMQRISSWRSTILIALDRVYFELCLLVVHITVALQSVPFLRDLTRRLTFMSGEIDTNANLCMFLRQLYSRASPPIIYDYQEVYFASMFMESQYTVLSWIVTHLSWRLLPPLLRPLFKAYYGRAYYARDFLTRCIEDYGVEQILILGAGFDTNAYRSRNSRIRRDGKITERFVRVFEVDRPEVNALKLQGLRRSMSQAEYNYYTEGTVYVVCNFDKDSLTKRLAAHGFNPELSTAVLWEGVTYYLSKEALVGTLNELRQLFSTCTGTAREHRLMEVNAIPKTPQIKEARRKRASSCESESAVSSSDKGTDAISQFSRESSTSSSSTTAQTTTSAPGNVYLFMDYMLETETLEPEKMEQNRLWRASALLAQALGTKFVTGFTDAVTEMQEFGWHCTKHITYEAVEREFFTGLPHALAVFEERNSTYGHNEPKLNCIECVFADRMPPSMSPLTSPLTAPVGELDEPPFELA